MSELVVSKFGGSSITSQEDVERIKELVEQDARRKVIVVSAPGKSANYKDKVTDMLIELSKSRDGNLLEKIVERYSAICSEFSEEIREHLTERFNLRLDETNYRNSLEAFGEEMSARMLAKMTGWKFVDAKDFFVLDENKRILPESYQRIEELKKEIQGPIVFPGFYGRTKEGEIITFPRGGSDDSAAHLARGLGAEFMEKFTDSEIFSAHPSIVEDPSPIREMTYDELRALTYSGFGIVNTTASLVLNRGKVIPMRVASRENPSQETWIVGDRIVDEERPVVGVAYKEGFCAFEIDMPGMNDMHGVMGKIDRVFHENKIPIEFKGGGIDDVSLVVGQTRFTEKHILDRIRSELTDFVGDDARINFRQNLGNIAVVGKEIKYRPEVEIGVLECLKSARIRVVEKSSGENVLLYSVEKRNGRDAVEKIYDRFLK